MLLILFKEAPHNSLVNNPNLKLFWTLYRLLSWSILNLFTRSPSQLTLPYAFAFTDTRQDRAWAQGGRVSQQIVDVGVLADEQR